MKRAIPTVLLTIGLVLVVAAGAVTHAQAPTKIMFALTTKDISVGHAAHSSIPQALGYWKEEGLDVTVASVEGSTAGAQQIAAGNLQVVSVGPEVVLISREKGVKIRAFYVQARENIFRIVVPADSPIKEIKDLKGKTVGVPSLASGSVPYTKALVASVGLDPDKDVPLLAVGLGAPMGLALQQKKVDALAVWDTLQAGLELRGFNFRRVSAPIHNEMIGQSMASSDSYLAEHPKAAIGFARGVAKATLFGLTNPEAAVRIHWKLYPETKPQGVDEAKALKDAIHVFNARFELQRVDHRDDKRYGAATAAQWDRLKQIYKDQKLIQGTTSAADLYDGRLVDEINRFDKQAVIRQAKEWKP
ncbi:MAG: ABC transporter substrate-binding protein [Candidatus Rokubacteria bacterium]|nr:ABC transporter substrate-binding protein [Candidatus Rokubacteria bacterium]